MTAFESVVSVSQADVPHVPLPQQEVIAVTAIAATKALGKKAGITLKPGTPAKAILPFIKEVDLALVMTVEHGFGGQTFMYDQLPKIKQIREYIDTIASDVELEVDGGVDAKTAAFCIEAGAEVLVAGSAVFGKADRAAAIQAIKNCN